MIFISCALALSPRPITVYQMLVEFVHQTYPGAIVELVNDRNIEISDYEKLPFTFQGANVWIKPMRRSA